MTGGNATVAEAMFTQGKNMKSAAEIQRQYDNESKAKGISDAKRQGEINKMLDKTIQLFRDTGPALKNMYAAMNRAFAPLYDALFGGRKSIIEGLTSFFNGLSGNSSWMKGITAVANTIKYLTEQIVKLMSKATPENLAMIAKLYGGVILARGGMSIAGSAGGIVSGIAGVAGMFGAGAKEGWRGKPGVSSKQDDFIGFGGTDSGVSSNNPNKWYSGEAWKGRAASGVKFGVGGGILAGAGGMAAMYAENKLGGEQHSTGAIVGSGVGSVAGGAIGAAIGSFIPVVGTAIGMGIGTWLGGKGGEWVGNKISGGSGGGTEADKKLKEVSDRKKAFDAELSAANIALKIKTQEFREERELKAREQKQTLDDILLEKRNNTSYAKLSEEQKRVLSENKIEYNKISSEALPKFKESIDKTAAYFDSLIEKAPAMKEDFASIRRMRELGRGGEDLSKKRNIKEEEKALLEELENTFDISKIDPSKKGKMLSTFGLSKTGDVDSTLSSFKSYGLSDKKDQLAKDIESLKDLQIKNEKEVQEIRMKTAKDAKDYQEFVESRAEWKVNNVGKDDTQMWLDFSKNKDLVSRIGRFAPKAPSQKDSGGIAMVASTVRVAQNGVPEAIVPLPKGGLSSLVPPINVTLMLDKQVLARVVAKQLVSQSLGTG